MQIPSYPQVTFYIVEPDEATQRLDNYLTRKLKGVPSSCIYRIIRRGEVRINSGRVSAEYRIRAGDKVRVPPIRMSAEPPPKTLTNQAKAQLSASLIAESGDYLILNKPSGLAVHGGSGVSHGLIEQWRLLRPDAVALELVHRLDKDTSGLLILAQKRSALRTLQAAWNTGTVQKHYLALLQGDWKGPATVSVPLRKHHTLSGERVIKADVEGKASTTYFEVIQRFKTVTLVRATLETGRMHQIRAHATYMGHPVAGDEKYGDRAFNQLLKQFGLHRLFLHAHQLTWSEAGWDWEAPLPPELLAVLDNLEKHT